MSFPENVFGGLPQGSMFYEWMQLRENYALGTDRDNSATNSDVNLNTVVANHIMGASLGAAGIISLPIGQYSVFGFGYLYRSDRCRISLVDSVDAFLVLGMSWRALTNSANASCAIPIFGEFELLAAEDVNLQMYANQGRSDGAGVGVNIGTVETFTDLMIFKLDSVIEVHG